MHKLNLADWQLYAHQLLLQAREGSNCGGGIGKSNTGLAGEAMVDAELISSCELSRAGCDCDNSWVQHSCSLCQEGKPAGD